MIKELLRLAGEAWATIRFVRLANALAAVDGDSPAIALFRPASEDERRHARLCTELAAAYGQTAAGPPLPPSEVAPPELTPQEALLHESVAACCITETESVATLTTLLAKGAEPRWKRWADRRGRARANVLVGRPSPTPRRRRLQARPGHWSGFIFE